MEHFLQKTQSPQSDDRLRAHFDHLFLQLISAFARLFTKSTNMWNTCLDRAFSSFFRFSVHFCDSIANQLACLFGFGPSPCASCHRSSCFCSVASGMS